MSQEIYAVTVDDDSIVSEIISSSLGMTSHSFLSTQSVLDSASQWNPFVAFIDVHVEKYEAGLNVLPYLRKIWEATPLIVITADSEPTLIARALNMGADDFIRKPLDANELSARTHIRRQDLQRRIDSNYVSIGDITLNKVSRLLVGPNGKEFISPMAANLLIYMIRSSGLMIGREAIKTYLWQETAVTENAMNKKISEIKHALSSVSQAVSLQVKYGEGVVLQVM